MVTVQPQNSETVVILAPIGRDAELIHGILKKGGMESRICASVDELCVVVAEGTGTAVIADEALKGSASQRLLECLAMQPSWSDLPIILLTRNEVVGYPHDSVYADAILPLGHVTLLERPVRIATLISAARTALRSRRRQYEVNRNLEQLRDAQEEIRLINAQLHAAWEDALEASRVKSRFLANMSHELRTPLNAVIGYSEMMMEDAKDTGDEKLSQDAARIVGAGRHLLELITDLLDLSKIEAGRMILKFEQFDLRGLVSDSEELIRPLAAQNNNVLDFRLPPPDWLMMCDQARVRQALLNLLSNACKFTENGTVGLDVQKEPGWYLFNVRDTGIGIPADQKAQLFQEFVQLDGGIRQGGGTGLGLALTKRLCELMGGSVNVESNPGEGSVFTIRLPHDCRTDVPGGDLTLPRACTVTTSDRRTTRSREDSPVLDVIEKTA